MPLRLHKDDELLARANKIVDLVVLGHKVTEANMAEQLPEIAPEKQKELVVLLNRLNGHEEQGSGLPDAGVNRRALSFRRLP